MSDLKLVSVIIPTFNRRELLQKAIHSVLDQTYKNVELIIVDDCSTDDTYAYVKSIDDSRVKYFRNEQTLYAPHSRNVGIQQSMGDFVAFLDDDDIWLPQKLEKQISLFDEQAVGIVYSSITLLYEDYDFSYNTSPQKHGHIYHDMLIKNFIGGTVSVVVRKKYLSELKSETIFDLDFPAREEYDLWIRLSKICKVNYVKEALVVAHYRNNISRISSDVNNYKRAIDILNSKYETEINEVLTKGDRKMRTYDQQFFLGSQAIKIGNARLARKFFLAAFMKKKQVKALLSYLISFFGAKSVIVSRYYFDRYMNIRSSKSPSNAV